MDTTIARHLTVGELARQLGSDIHRVEYLIRSRSIRPVGMAGNARGFSRRDLKRRGEEMRRIDEAKLNVE